MELTATDGKPVSIRVHAATPTPPLVDSQRPPLAAPAQTREEFEGSTATVSILPPTLSGPIEVHVAERRALSSMGMCVRVCHAFQKPCCGINAFGYARCPYHHSNISHAWSSPSRSSGPRMAARGPCVG